MIGALFDEATVAELHPGELDRIRCIHPDYERDHISIETACRDCAIAYYWNPFVGQDEFDYIGWSTTLYAGVDDAARTAYIVFRGTDRWNDWIINGLFLPLPLAHPWAHAGFVGTWKLAKRKLMPWLRSQAGRFDRIVVSGHSLGGALALACAYELKRDGLDVHRCITVGAPRVYMFWSAPKVEKMLAGRVLRLTREQDIVATVPPAMFGFRHVGQAWAFLAELRGERIPERFPVLSEWFAKGLHLMHLGPIGDWLEKQGMPSNMTLQIGIFILAGLAGLGAWAAAAVQGLVGVLLIGSVLLGVASAVLVGITAHHKGRYAATRRAKHVIDEWQQHHMPRLSEGKPRKPAGPDSVIVELSLSIRASHSEANKRRLIHNFERMFGADAHDGVLGRAVAMAQVPSSARAAFNRIRGDTEEPSEARFERVCMLLLMHGYEPEEIDSMLDDGVIGRPRQWQRFYARTAPATSEKPGLSAK